MSIATIDTKTRAALKISALYSTEDKFVEKQTGKIDATEAELRELYNELKSEAAISKAEVSDESIDTDAPTKAVKTPKVKTEKIVKEKVVKEPKAKKEKVVKEPKASKEPRVKAEKVSKDKEVTTELQVVIDDTTTSRSVKMRQLFKAGFSIGQIARVLKSHYSFVQSALKRSEDPTEVLEKGGFKKKEEVSNEEVASTEAVAE